MLIVTSPEIAMGIADPHVRRLVLRRYDEICASEPYDYDRHGELIVVEPGDSVAALEEEGGCPILTNPFDGTRFGDPRFTPVFEAIERHPGCFEVVAILNDDGFGIALFVPMQPAIDPELLAMCERHAQPATGSAPR